MKKSIDDQVIEYSKSLQEAGVPEEFFQKAKKGFPIGTKRVWNGITYVKHHDGWVAATGEHKGKLMGKFKTEPTHTKFAEEQIKTVSEADKKEYEKQDEKVTQEYKESRDNEPDPLDTPNPRESAKKRTRKQLKSKEEYAYARNSKISNIGEDVFHSARHIRNEWKNLATSEKNGTADAMITRKALFKNEPIDLMSKITKANYPQVLFAYLIINKFPPGPPPVKYLMGKKDNDIWGYTYEGEGYGEEGTKKSIPAVLLERSHKSVDSLKNAKPITVGEYKKALRKEYFETYMEVKGILEKEASSKEEFSPREMSERLREHMLKKIKKHREENRYSDISNNYIGFYKNGLSWYGKKSSAEHQLVEFHQSAADIYSDKATQMERYKDLTSNVNKHLDKLVQHAKDVLEGDSLNKTFGKESSRKRKKKISDFYTKDAKRIGPKTGLDTLNKQINYLTKKAGMRAIQWGNSVTDNEREIHAEHVSNAFKDLTDNLNLPEEMASFNGKLALAIGARGKGSFAAHYEPSDVIINLTRKSGVGSLSHEWWHFFDNSIGKLSNSGEFASERNIGLENSPNLQDSFGKLNQAAGEMRLRMSRDKDTRAIMAIMGHSPS